MIECLARRVVNCGPFFSPTVRNFADPSTHEELQNADPTNAFDESRFHVFLATWARHHSTFQKLVHGTWTPPPSPVRDEPTLWTGKPSLHVQPYSQHMSTHVNTANMIQLMTWI